MDIFELLKKRRSVRRFKKKEIENHKVRKLVETANSAPSAGNLQAYQIFLVKDESRRKQLARAALNQDFVAQAPIDLVFCADLFRSSEGYGSRGETLYSIQDATIACAYVHLAAVDLGLGSVIVGAFDEAEVSKVLSLPRILRPIIILPVGYPDESPEKTSRRSLDDLVNQL
jgi:nitroreductase